MAEWIQHGWRQPLSRLDLLLNPLLHIVGVRLNVRAATLITHRLQRIVGYASQLHAVITVDGAVCNLQDDSDAIDSTDTLADTDGTQRDLTSTERAQESVTRESYGHQRRVEEFHVRSAVLGLFRDQRLGISLYGFVCDRDFFRGFHMVVLATALFIVTRALTNTGRAASATHIPTPQSLGWDAT